MAGRVDKRDVLAALSPSRALDYFSVEHRLTGGRLRTGICPSCGPRARNDAVAIDPEHGGWRCHAHGCSGDLLHLVAGYASLSIEREFSAVVELAASIAGVLPSDDPEAEARRARAIAVRQRRAQDLAEREARLRARAQANAPGVWCGLAEDHPAGRAYLARRGLERVIALGEVRFGAVSRQTPDRLAVCVPLRAADGTIVNVVGRYWDGGDPKIQGLFRCGADAAFGDPLRVNATLGEIVIVEGLADYLSARLLWPDRLVLGAHAASHLPDVARIAAPLAKKHERGLLLVPHNDKAGLLGIEKALDAIGTTVPTENLEVFALSGGDLNDYLVSREQP